MQLPLSWTNHTYWQILYPKMYFYIPRLFAHCDGCDCLYIRCLNKMLHFIKQQVTWKDFVLYFLLDTLIHGDYFLNLDIFASHTKDVQFRWWHFRYYLCLIFFVCTKICEMFYISWEYFIFFLQFHFKWCEIWSLPPPTQFAHYGQMCERNFLISHIIFLTWNWHENNNFRQTKKN